MLMQNIFSGTLTYNIECCEFLLRNVVLYRNVKCALSLTGNWNLLLITLTRTLIWSTDYENAITCNNITLKFNTVWRLLVGGWQHWSTRLEIVHFMHLIAASPIFKQQWKNETEKNALQTGIVCSGEALSVQKHKHPQVLYCLLWKVQSVQKHKHLPPQSNSSDFCKIRTFYCTLGWTKMPSGDCIFLPYLHSVSHSFICTLLAILCRQFLEGGSSVPGFQSIKNKFSNKGVLP